MDLPNKKYPSYTQIHRGTICKKERLVKNKGTQPSITKL